VTIDRFLAFSPPLLRLPALNAGLALACYLTALLGTALAIGPLQVTHGHCAGRDQRRDDALRYQPAPRLGPRQERGPIARGPREGMGLFKHRNGLCDRPFILPSVETSQDGRADDWRIPDTTSRRCALQKEKPTMPATLPMVNAGSASPSKPSFLLHMDTERVERSTPAAA